MIATLGRIARLFLITGLLSSLAVSATLIVPGLDAATEGDSNNFYPFGIGGTFSMRYQQVYDSSEFISVGGPVLITAIDFRPDGSFGFPFAMTLPNVQIDLSTTAATPGSLSTTFATNVGADDQIVQSGALTLSSAFTGPAGGPKAFDITITLATPFLYNPANGNLLMDIRNFSGTAAASGVVFDADSTSASIQRVYTLGVGSTTGSISGARGLVTQFEFTPSTVPEPGTIWSAGLVMLGLAMASIRRRCARDERSSAR